MQVTTPPEAIVLEPHACTDGSLQDGPAVRSYARNVRNFEQSDSYLQLCDVTCPDPELLRRSSFSHTALTLAFLEALRARGFEWRSFLLSWAHRQST